MKHNFKITLILLAMFLISQLIGIAVIHAYSVKELPYGMQPPQDLTPNQSFSSIIFALIIAVILIFLLMKIKATILLRLWFFFVVIIALSITFNAGLLKFPYSNYIALILAVPLAFFKIFRRNILVHNFTELLIYPGIAAVFVPILSLWAVILLLLLISIYDIYAVWHAGFMQKMAKFQINKVKVFAGFFLPYLGKKQEEKIKLLREKYKNSKEKLKKQKIKVNLAILGGGDVVFPMILVGVVLRNSGFFPALIISLFATLSLLFLFMFAKKGKAYPAMPFLTAGCLFGLLVAYFIFSLF